MEDSILTSVKKLLGIVDEYTQFDTDIIMHINSVFNIYHQLGLGPDAGFHIEDKTSKWNEFTNDETLLNMVKSDMYFRVRLMFDPPANSTVLESFKKQIDELEWRLNLYYENGDLSDN